MNSGCRLRKLFFKGVLCVYLFVVAQYGCDSGHRINSVDKDVYKVIEEKWDKSFAGRSDYKIDFDAEPRGDLAIEELIGETGVLGLSDAVAFATGHSYLYQEEKEVFCLQGLDMILANHNLFAFPDKSGAGVVTKGNGKAVADKMSTTAELAEVWSAVLTEALRKGTTSQLSGLLAQPLPNKIKRGDDPGNMTQLDRDALYQLRSFNHFQKKFVVWIKTGYYRVLQGQDGVKAAMENHKTLEETCENMGKLLGAGRIQRYELDRAYQEKLQAWEGYLSAKGNYEQLLDEFKLEIGAPVRTEFCLDEKELAILREAGASQESLSMEEAIENVLENRLDLANLADELTDRLHKVFRTAYNPNGRLDFIDHSTKVSDEQLEHPSLEYLEKQFNLEFSEDMSFDQLNEHNEFRKDMIAMFRKYREYAQKVNKIIMDVRSEYRDIEEATERYRLQLESIKLAQKRANDSFALLRNDIGNVGDVLRAQDDLHKANIGATEALVDSAIAIMKIQVQPDATWQKWDWKN